MCRTWGRNTKSGKWQRLLELVRVDRGPGRIVVMFRTWGREVAMIGNTQKGRVLF